MTLKGTFQGLLSVNFMQQRDPLWGTITSSRKDNSSFDSKLHYLKTIDWHTLWDTMETWSPHRFLGIVRTIELDEFIHKLDLWRDIQKWGTSHCPPISWHGKVFSKIWKDLPWMITMSFAIISPKKSKHSAFIGLQTTCWSHLFSIPILWQLIHRWHSNYILIATI